MRWNAVSLFALIAGLTLATALPAAAQQTRVLQDDEWCDRGDRWSSRHEQHCEVHEYALPANRDVVRVDGRQNGGIRVVGWGRNEILVRARIQANARSESTARRLVDDVDVVTSDNTIYARVPDPRNNEGVSVSFEVFVPERSNLSLETHNGGISIAGVHGRIEFDALNGGVSLADLGGDVRGETTNGGLEIALSGTEWDGEGLDVETTNGGIELVVPEGYSARLETRTVNGHVELGFPVMVQGRVDRRIETDLGRGGKTIRVVTTNGGVEVRRG